MAVDASMPTPVVSAPGTNSGTSSGSSSGSGLTTSKGIADNFQTFLTMLTTELQN